MSINASGYPTDQIFSTDRGINKVMEIKMKNVSKVIESFTHLQLPDKIFTCFKIMVTIIMKKIKA
jgi:hypothetical protein